MEYKFPQLKLKKGIDKKTTLIIVTSPIPSHPSTDLIDEAIESVMQMNYKFQDVIISYDCPPKKKHIPSYETYKSKMKEKYPKFKHLEMKDHGHFIGSFYNALSHTKTKYFMMLQHDIKLVGNLPIDDLLKMKLNWNILATHHVTDGLNKTHWYPIIEKKNKYVDKTWGWSERIFLSKRDFFLKQIYDCYHTGRTKNFMDTIFYKEFKKLYQTTEKIKEYKKINPSKEQMKEYNQFWNEWKCFNIKSGVCYHEHLHGRTKKNRTKKKGKMEGVVNDPSQGGYTVAKDSAKANRELGKYMEQGQRTKKKIDRKEEATKDRGTHKVLLPKFKGVSDTVKVDVDMLPTGLGAIAGPDQFKKVSEDFKKGEDLQKLGLKKANPLKDKKKTKLKSKSKGGLKKTKKKRYIYN